MSNFDNSNKIKHLDMIEAIIERMAKNSFQLKGWTMTLVAAVVALASHGSNQKFILFAFIPVVGFCGLDAFYLQQERKFKQLYKNVIKKDDKDIDFNLDASLATGTEREMQRLCYCNCLCSPSIWMFYGIIFIAMFFLAFVLKII